MACIYPKRKHHILKEREAPKVLFPMTEVYIMFSYINPGLSAFAVIFNKLLTIFQTSNIHIGIIFHANVELTIPDYSTM